MYLGKGALQNGEYLIQAITKEKKQLLDPQVSLFV